MSVDGFNYDQNRTNMCTILYRGPSRLLKTRQMVQLKSNRIALTHLRNTDKVFPGPHNTGETTYFFGDYPEIGP
jgi:hypothetical protein